MAAYFNIDWKSEESNILINPQYSFDEQLHFKALLVSSTMFPAHIWMSTSGSRSSKWVGVSKMALLESAEAINQHLQCQSTDSWVHALPEFHVGGLGIRARSYLNRSEVFDFKLDHPGKWDAELFCAYVKRIKGTLTALVPAQLYDLVRLKIKSPPSLRAVIIGGGYLPESLYHFAVDLGWKVLPSYGMTECCSQIATAEIGSWEYKKFPALKILSHMKVKTEDQRIFIKSSALLSAYGMESGKSWQFIDPKIEGWFPSDDRGMANDQYLHLYGRMDHMIKIGGESVDMIRLENILQEIQMKMNCEEDLVLLDLPDERLGRSIHLFAAKITPMSLKPIIESFHKRVLPFEKIRQIHIVDRIPRSPMQKVLRGELVQLVGL